MAYTLPPLPYAFDALEPSIDARTMEIHHGKHHATYITNVNKALEGHDNLASLPVEKLIADLEKVPRRSGPSSATTVAATPIIRSSGRRSARARGALPAETWERPCGRCSAASTPSRPRSPTPP